MTPSTQALEDIARIIKSAYRDAVASGVDPAEAAEVLMRAGSELVQMEIEHHKILVELHRHIGTRALSTRRGVTMQTIRNRVNRAVNKIAKRMA